MCTHNIPFFIIKKKLTPDYSKSAAMGFFPRDSRMRRNSRGKRAISVRATEVLLYWMRGIKRDNISVRTTVMFVCLAKVKKGTLNSLTTKHRHFHLFQPCCTRNGQNSILLFLFLFFFGQLFLNFSQAKITTVYL